MQAIKQALADHAPAPVVAWAWTTRKRYFPNPHQARQNTVYRKIGNPDSVLEGPFRGMRYLRISYASSTLNKTLGVYEMEILPSIEALIALDPDVFVDAGTAEGYYLVGMATRTRARCVGYEMVSLSRHLAGRLARLNGVSDRVEVRGRCTPGDLEAVLAPAARPAMLCDIDGGEFECLRPDLAPALQRTTIIVELHDMIVPGVSDEIRRRFEPTHDIRLLPVRLHLPSDVPERYALSEEEALFLLDENRPPENFWYYMRPREA